MRRGDVKLSQDVPIKISKSEERKREVKIVNNEGNTRESRRRKCRLGFLDVIRERTKEGGVEKE